MEIGKYIFLLAVLLSGCAQMVPPSGGPKDVNPPQVIEENTFPKNKSTLFNSKTIVITFDEYIKINNPKDNIIISPALDKSPDFVLKGKKVMVKFNSDLKPNTTYTINFGNAIADITENNPAAGLTYVFSTGEKLDSLSIQGQVTNAFSNAPEKNCWVVLHKNLSDTAIQKSFPDYLTKTDNNGYYRLQNLAAGDYKIFALRDGNSDYKYNMPSEEIAFSNEVISLNENISSNNLRLFKEDNEKQFVKSSSFSWPGKVRLIMNKPYDSWFAFKAGDDSTQKSISSIYKTNSRDTLDIWVKPSTLNEEELKIVLPIKNDTIKENDTINIFIPSKKEETKKLRLTSNASRSFSIYDKLRLRFDRPVALIDKSKLTLLKKDSIPVSLEYETIAYGELITNQWEEKTDYTLIISKGAFKELYYGFESEQDTIHFTTVKRDFYGNILANISVPNEDFILELYNGKNKLVYFQALKSNEKLTIENLTPGNYKLKIIEDINHNGKWDSGDISLQKQPEKIYQYKENITIRSNWDFDLTWKIEN